MNEIYNNETKKIPLIDIKKDCFDYAVEPENLLEEISKILEDSCMVT